MIPFRLRLRSLMLLVAATCVALTFADRLPVCAVHRCLMSRRTVPRFWCVRPHWADGRLEAKNSSFPNSDDFVMGGPEQPKFTYNCARCISARDAWDWSHPDNLGRRGVHDETEDDVSALIFGETDPDSRQWIRRLARLP